MAQTLALHQTQHLALTPQLKQALAILQLSTVELSQLINKALEENPLLEAESTEETTDNYEEEFDRWDIPSSGGEPWEGKEKDLTLAEHLRIQAGCLMLSNKDFALLNWLIGSLNDDGFLCADLEEIANEGPFSEEITLSDWRAALLLLQSLEPTGIGAKDFKDSLLIQIRLLNQSGKFDERICFLAKQAVSEYLELIAHRRSDKLKEILNCTENELRSTFELISCLTPRPASCFSSETINYVIPEIRVFRNSHGEWKTVLSDQALPKIKVNELYAECLNSDDSSSLWHARLREARELIRSIDQRRLTLLRVSEAIVQHQAAFFSEGPVAMKPLVLRQIADELGLHESTVSRVSNGKYLLCPAGIFELKYFFSAQISDGSADRAFSSTAVKTFLKKLLDEENPMKPLSDAKLATLLGEQGFPIARRTVAKYREALGFASASQRKKFNSG